MALKSIILSVLLALRVCYANEVQMVSSNFVTQTVYGFLDFTTTIGDTVMIFLPNSAPAFEIPSNEKSKTKTENVINTEPYQNETKHQIKPSKSVNEKHNKVSTPDVEKGTIRSKVITSKVGVVEAKKNILSKVEIKENSTPVTQVVGTHLPINDDEAYTIQNDLAEPEYDYLSRQPPAYAEESYKIINVKPSVQQKQRSKTEIPKAAGAKDAQPTGLVTKLSGTVIKDGVTTIHETSVIGTFISNRYAQVLQSSSHIYKNNNKPKVLPSSTIRILKTAAPTTPVTIEAKAITVRPNTKGRRQEQSAPKIQNRFRNKNRREDPSKQDSPIIVESSPAPTTSSYSRKESKSRRHHKNNSSQRTPAPQTPQNENQGRRSFKPKIQPANVNTDTSTTLYKFKLNRTPGRWQYKTSPKPRVSIRKSVENDNQLEESPSNSKSIVTEPEESSKENIANQKGEPTNTDSQSNDVEPDVASSPNVKYLVETLNVEISTPPDFQETYYEIATIKTPYTFQVGTVKNTRFITVTSTFEKSLEPEPTVTLNPGEPLTENILATSKTHREVNLLDSSIGTLPTLYLSSDEATVPLETKTETYSVTQNVLKTQILPIVQEGQNASSLTLIHTYRLTRLVTATKTLPPSEAYQFVASKRLKEFNSKLDEAGSELHLELEFGDDNEEDEDTNDEDALKESDPISSLLNGDTSDFDLFDRSKSPSSKKSKKNPPQSVSELPTNKVPSFSPAQLQQLALLGFLNPGATPQLPQVITTSKPVVKLETIYESHVIPFHNGHITSYSTISKSVGTKEVIDYELITSTVALPIPPVPQNPIFQQHPQIQITTTPIVTQTFATQTQSKILKLTFGAKTAYTTIFSTKVVPTVLTTYITASISLQPTAPAFPGFFPAPYAPYPFVG